MGTKVNFSCFTLLVALVHVHIVGLALLLMPVSCLRSSSSDDTDSDIVEITKLYVRPDEDSRCPEWIEKDAKCESLSYYIQRVDIYFVSNTCVEFLEGNHIMEINRPVRMENVTNFSLIGSGSKILTSDGSPFPSSQIICLGSMRSGFYFINSSDIQVENLAISQCGLRLGRWVKVLAALAFDTVFHVMIESVRIYNCTGFGVHADRILGNSTISNSAFVHNVGTNDFYGGNVRLWYRNCPPDVTTSLRIKKSWFMHGYDVKKSGAFFPYATGLTLLIDCPFVHADIDNITTMNNTADNGGNLAIRLNFTSYQPGIGSVLLQRSFIKNGKGHRGGGLRVWSRIYGSDSVSCSKVLQNYTTLRVVNTTFIGNHAYSAGGALYISHYEEEHIDCYMRTIVFDNCTFTKNNVPSYGNGAVAEIIKHKIPSISAHASPQFQVNFSNSSFIENTIPLNHQKLVHGSILDIFSVDKIKFVNCTFVNNNSTAISTVESNIVLSGRLVFRNNTAVNGGAIKFCDSSYMFIENNTFALFEENSASNAGGAIFAQQRCLETAPSCFFQPLVKDFTKLSDLGDSIKMSLKFINNTAHNAGNALYGGFVDYCYTFKRFVDGYDKSYYLSFQVFNKIFDAKSNKDPHNDISSNPYGVCLCDMKTKTPRCGKANKSLTLSPKFPGEEFQIMAVAVGQRSGFSTAVVSAVVIENPSRSIVKELTTKPLHQCTKLKFYVHTDQEKVVFNLTVQETNLDAYSFYYRYHYPQITVPIKHCPWGFKLQNDSEGRTSCQCHPALTKNSIKCNLKSGEVIRRGSKWVGFDWSKFKSVEEYRNKCQDTNANVDPSCWDVLVSPHCPYDYCNQSKVPITATSIQDQCNFDHTGVLCGACQEGKSLVTGGSKCRGCKNDTLVPLIISILASGFLLVFVLIIFNLTVTEGTLNGLIFYMNFIQVNQSIYLPEEGLWYGGRMLASIVAMFNLDLGFQVCVYDGMDAYVKTWFQFLFPVYIWLIVVGIIVLSRKFVLVQRLIGKNAVKILATLFLLSIAKLNQAIISVFSYVTVEFPSGSRQHVNIWMPDGNVRYLRGKHIILFLGGLFFLILIMLYTFLVMFSMCLQRLPSKCFFSIFYRLKPFFDAHTGPYKTRYRFWTGLLLLTRSILFTIFSISVLNFTHLKLMLTVLMCILLLSLMALFYGVYKRFYLNLLEMIAFLNLGVTSSLSSYLISFNNHHGTVAVGSISVFVACLTFLIVLFFHGYRQIRSSRILRKFLSSISRSSSKENLLSYSQQADVERPTTILTQTEVVVTPPGEEDAKKLLQNLNSVVAGNEIPKVERYSQCREPLIEEDSDS